MKTPTPTSPATSTVPRAAAVALLAAAPVLLVNAAPLWLRLDALFSGKLWLVAGVFALFAVFAVMELRATPRTRKVHVRPPHPPPAAGRAVPRAAAHPPHPFTRCTGTA